MMNSNILSRLLPSTGSPSIYEAIRNDDEASISDTEERAAMALDEENLRESLHSYNLEDAADSQVTTHSTAFLGQRPHKKSSNIHSRKTGSGAGPSRPRWMHSPRGILEADEGDDDVPASLLVEGNDMEDLPKPPAPPPHHIDDDHNRFPDDRPSPLISRDQWRTGRDPQDHVSFLPAPILSRARRTGGLSGMASASPKDKAMWRWANVENLDNFLKDVYIYYLGNGIWCILLSRTLNLLTLAFVVGFTTFLSSCVNYSAIPNSESLDKILVPRCMTKISTSTTLLLWLFTFFWIGKFIQYVLDVRRLRQMHDFYLYLLNISDPEIQTISWQEVVSRLMTLRDSNPATAAAIPARHRRFMGSQSKQRMDAHDIANRLMRKENYLIALFNKDILDLTLPVPFLRNRQLFSRTLEWNLNLCILDYVFNEQGQVRPLFLKDTHRRALSEGLRRRFVFAGIMNIFVAPFIVVYFMMHYFFRYFNEYQKNPSQIGSRQYTPLAEWKFREFNELWHLFQRRINMSYPFASRYVDQFPKDKTVQISRFVAFIAGALASVLALASLLDPELFLGFEITPGRTVLFYLGIFGSVWAVARGLVPEETDVFDPEFALIEVTDFTHYRPAHWTGRLHSDEVRQEFAMLYQMKIVIFLEEILSMIFTPFVLWFSLPKCSDRLIDFFREFTVHVDGLGYVCSFAVFDFKKGTNANVENRDIHHNRPARDLRDDYFSTKDGKMLASYYGFLDSYGANPRAGAGPGTRRRFHPPPSFPALGSALPADATPRPERYDQTQIRQSPATGPLNHYPTMRASRFGGPPAPGSPLHSMLLDPHHQPSASALRSTNRVGNQPRSRQYHQAATSNDVTGEAKELSIADGPSSSKDRVAQSGQVGEDSTGAVATSDNNLEGSWRINLAGEADDDDSVEEGDEVEAVVNGPGGVLGLLQQFQKVNNESRAGGGTVGI
ncbi:putative autophagy protein Apg9 [Talaromyces proteolyticus]|uniref:Autophagy-related protein 9 n=1 Tax=Talaromyces proteolyticus TaxID=1131652 RepID=A0AAD4L0H1_9EURO|nr:putative autophagy protein Apg9 [Talaromyces proteolyticus]KAH8701861.1 putative autophagy protein Apg9 [Talaromyces proteolyticus]